MIKNVTFFNLSADSALRSPDIVGSLERYAFKPTAAFEASNVGFVDSYVGTGLLHSIGNGLHGLCIRQDSRRPNASAVREAMKVEVAKIEEEQGYKPGRKQTKEIKEKILDAMLPKTFPNTRYIRAYTTPTHLIVEGTTGATADVVLGLIAKVIGDADSFGVSNVYVNKSPVAAMTEWSVDDNEPDGFTIDQMAHLESQGGAQVKIKNMTVQADEVRQHVQAGKQVVRLGMTHDDRMTFELDEDFKLRSIKMLDIVNAGIDQTQDGEDVRNASLMMWLSEIEKTIEDLIDAFGGEKTAF